MRKVLTADYYNEDHLKFDEQNFDELIVDFSINFDESFKVF